MALPEIEVDFTRRDDQGRVLLDQADLSFYRDPVGWKGFFCDSVSGAVGTIEEGPVARLWHRPFVIIDVPAGVQEYFELLNRLDEHRAKPGRPEEDPEEDAILDAMDPLWYSMTPDEIDVLESHVQTRWGED